MKIILGCNEGTQFKAVTVVNRNISKPFEIRRGCRQGDPISGYLFILVMEILALLLKKSLELNRIGQNKGWNIFWICMLMTCLFS